MALDPIDIEVEVDDYLDIIVELDYSLGAEIGTVPPKPHDLQYHLAEAVRKTSAYVTTDTDSFLELEGNFILTLHTPTTQKMLTLVSISGQQTLATVVGLVTLLAGESVDLYYNGTEWRVY